jgi:hypothetical protein
MTHEPMEWVCETCLTVYGEYVNGCPKCWANKETRSKVLLMRASELIERAVKAARRV